MTLSDYLRSLREALSSLYPPQEVAAIASRLCRERLGVDRYRAVVHPEWEIPPAALPGMQEAARRLSAGEPLQYVLGYADFCGRRFRVAPGVLIPRPETEQLCRLLMARTFSRIIDLCTGSGCIAWTLAAAFPQAEVVAVDLSEQALGIARTQNPVGDGAPAGIPAPCFVRADVLAPGFAVGTEAGFDLIVSNPPYVRESERAQMHPNVLEHEPPMALFVPDDDPLCFYRAIAAFARRRLAPGGLVALEVNEAFPEAVCALFEGFPSRILPDTFGKKRFVLAEKPRS